MIPAPVLGHSRRGLGHPTALMSPGWRCARASSLTSLRQIPQPSALAKMVARNLQSPIGSAQEAAGVSLSEVKEETAKPAGDMSRGSRPPPLVHGATKVIKARRSNQWAN